MSTYLSNMINEPNPNFKESNGEPYFKNEKLVYENSNGDVGIGFVGTELIPSRKLHIYDKDGNAISIRLQNDPTKYIDINLKNDGNVNIDSNDNTVTLNNKPLLPYHNKTAIPFWGTLTELERGWQICDGTNGTPDLREQFIRGASIDSQVGTTKQDSTALPNNSFSVSNDTHNHSVDPPNTNTTSDSHYHSVNPASVNTSSGGAHSHSITDPGHNHRTDADTATEIKGGSGDDLVVNNGDGYSRTVYSWSSATGISINTSSTHYHTVDIPSTNTSSDTHYHSVNIASFSSGSDTHNHTLSGGDSETAPQHILMYWIAYTGGLAPNWDN